MTGPIASADAVVAALTPDVGLPDVRARDVVLVAGPWLAGTTGVLAALRDRMPGHTFVEADDLTPADAPAAVVFVVSAAAPLTESDCALLDLRAQHTDLVIGVVSKTDAHRTWRDVLDADRALLAERAPRHAHLPWVGAAASPDLGEPRVEELVGLLREGLADPGLDRRNRLRAWETRLQAVMDRLCADGAGSDSRARVATLHQDRDDVARGRRLVRSERTIASRSQLQQARVQLGAYARNRCASVRAELAEDAALVRRGRLGAFETQVRTRAGELVAEVDEGIIDHLADVAGRLQLRVPPTPEPPPAPTFAPPPLTSRRLETQLMTVLGAGFGLGVALVVTRLFAGLAPGWTVGGLAAGGLAGVAVTVWVVGIRGLLHDRAVLDRWVSDVVGTVKSALDERVATRVLAAETAWASQLADRDEADSSAAGDRIAEIDAELREHAGRTARAAALRDRRLPSLQAALDAVRGELWPLL